jgi:hypothetical protein
MIRLSRQQLSSLAVAELAVDGNLSDDPEIGPSVQRQSRVRLRRPATGVSGAESLSSSEEEESRLSPVRGCFGRGKLSSESDVDGVSAADNADAFTGTSERRALESDDVVDARDDRVETDASISEWASVYLTVVISSSSGVRKETRFSAGNMGREAAILRGIIDRAGLLARTETRLCGCL